MNSVYSSGHAVVVFDGECAFCNRWVDFPASLRPQRHVSVSWPASRNQEPLFHARPDCRRQGSAPLSWWKRGRSGPTAKSAPAAIVRNRSGCFAASPAALELVAQRHLHRAGSRTVGVARDFPKRCRSRHTQVGNAEIHMVEGVKGLSPEREPVVLPRKDEGFTYRKIGVGKAEASQDTAAPDNSRARSDEGIHSIRGREDAGDAVRIEPESVGRQGGAGREHTVSRDVVD